MCFKSPKPPPPSTTGQDIADPALQRERAQAEVDASVLKAENKQRRMEDELALLQGRIGRHSLFTGGQGGAGYAAPLGRSLFVQNGASSGSSGSGGGVRPPRGPRGSGGISKGNGPKSLGGGRLGTGATSMFSGGSKARGQRTVRT